jgi:hypothetical protein
MNIIKKTLLSTFAKACLDDDLETIKNLVIIDKSFLETDSIFCKPFLLNKTEIAKYLLSLNVPYNQDKLFMIVCYKGNLELIKYFIENQIINFDDYKNVCLNYACLHNDVETIRYIISIKPDIEITQDILFNICNSNSLISLNTLNNNNKLDYEKMIKHLFYRRSSYELLSFYINLNIYLDNEYYDNRFSIAVDNQEEDILNLFYKVKPFRYKNKQILNEQGNMGIYLILVGKTNNNIFSNMPLDLLRYTIKYI